MIKYNLALLLLIALIMPPVLAVGDSDLLCSEISDDLSAAGGCVDEDGFEDATTSTLSIGMIEIGDSFGIIVFMFIIVIITAMALLGLSTIQFLAEVKQFSQSIRLSDKPRKPK